jgi:glycosyltransferase involved in cell wall biosynthesis
MNILVLTGSGMGGTEKAAYLFAESLAGRGHRVIMLSDPGYWRAKNLQQAGGIVLPYATTAVDLAQTVTREKIDAIHTHTSGYGGQSMLYAAMDILGKNRPRLIETNVFGQLLDFEDHNHVDFRIFISLTSGMQAFQRTGLGTGTPDALRHSVVFYPLSPDEVSPRFPRDAGFRGRHGVSEDEFLVCRVGRPGHKWATWECEAFQMARAKNSKLRMLLMEPGEELTRDILAKKYGGGIIVEKARSDAEYLHALYTASNLMLHASDFGESFGYTLAEGMIAGLPVITRTTPWGDNAQVELVRHGIDGYVCAGVKGMAGALLELSRDPELCGKMGESGRQRIAAMASLEKETDLLEEIIHSTTVSPPGKRMRERHAEWIDYIARYPDLIAPRCYEAEHRMTAALLGAKAYRSLRGTRQLKRFLKLRSRGHKVRFPFRWAG